VTVLSLHYDTDRIYADVSVSGILDARIASMRERNLRMVELESKKTRLKRVLLFEVLDLAAELQATVDEHGLSVAEVARRAGIAERDAQRLYKLPVEAIRQEITHGEAQFGAEYVYPSWRTRVPGHQSAPAPDTDDAVQGGTTNLWQRAPAADAATVRLLEIGRQIVAEVQKGRKANKELLAALEREQADLRRSTATSATGMSRRLLKLSRRRCPP